MQAIAIVALCIGSAVAYGILHDQVTARVCVEYFTIGHPPVFSAVSPTMLGIRWGIIATWWVGLLLGIPLAVAARAGRRTKRSAWSLTRPVVSLLLVMATCALLAGLAGYALGRSGAVYLSEPMASLVPRDRHARFQADLWAHSASYLVGFVGGIVVIVRVWSRSRPPLRSAVATALIVVGSIVFLFSRCINDILCGSFRYPDIRYSLPAESEVTPLPQMEAGKYEVWIEFTGHCPDLTGIAWKATTIDLDSGEATDSDDLRLATYSTSDGMRGVGVGTMRAATGRLYGLRIQCEGCEEGQSRVVLAHRPRVVVRAPVDVGKNDFLGVLFREACVASAGFLLVIVGLLVGLWRQESAQHTMGVVARRL